MSGDGPRVDAARVITDLRELDRRTGGPGGARRVCWGEEWRQAREFLRELLAELDLQPEVDEAGNLWAYLDGEASGGALAIGSHVDSVPAGGWLDGALGVMAALGVVRAHATHDRPPARDLALVDWVDEEGARFGRSLFGSSAFAGTLDPEGVRELRDSDGRALPDVLAENGVELGRVPNAAARRERLGAYVELHIEQGPVLIDEAVSAGVVSGCAGVERVRFVFRGQASHAGTTPMRVRRDAGLAAAAAALEIEGIPGHEGGVATTGALALSPGIPTAVAGEAELAVDLRHPDADALARMLEAARGAGAAAASARGCELDEKPLWRIEPIPFDRELVELGRAAVLEAGGRAEPMTSGALHDAAAVARVLPAAMLFAPSIDGISHAKEEDTSEEDLAVAIEAYGALANRLLERQV